MSDTRYKIEVQKGEGCHRKLTVKVPGAIFVVLHDLRVQEYATTMKSKGFRKGKVPRALVLKRHGDAIFKEVMETVMGNIWDEILKDESLAPAGNPRYDLEMAHDPLVITIDYEVYPTVKIGRLGGFRVERPNPREVKESDIDRVLRGLRMRETAWRRVNSGRPKPGDKVSARITRLGPASAKGKENGGHDRGQYHFVLGEGETDPELEEALYSLAPGESGVFGVTFLEDNDADSGGGIRLDLRIELVARLVSESPELNDDFVRSLKDTDANTVEELRSQVTQTLMVRALAVAEQTVDQTLWERATEAHTIDVPDCWIEHNIDWLYQNLAEEKGVFLPNPEAARAGMRPLVLERLKQEIFREAVITEMGLRPNDEDPAEQIFEDMAGEFGMSVADTRNRFSFVEDDEELRDRIAHARFQTLLRSKSEVVNASP